MTCATSSALRWASMQFMQRRACRSVSDSLRAGHLRAVCVQACRSVTACALYNLRHVAVPCCCVERKMGAFSSTSLHLLCLEH